MPGAMLSSPRIAAKRTAGAPAGQRRVRYRLHRSDPSAPSELSVPQVSAEAFMQVRNARQVQTLARSRFARVAETDDRSSRSRDNGAGERRDYGRDRSESRDSRRDYGGGRSNQSRTRGSESRSRGSESRYQSRESREDSGRSSREDTRRSSRSSSRGASRSSQRDNGASSSGVPSWRRVSSTKNKSHAGRFRGMDADQDMSDDQQDIARGRGMVDSHFQGEGGKGGTHNAILSSEEYLSTAQRNFNNMEEGYYISPAFLDKMTVHIAKNYMELPKIKVPLILGIWGGKGQGKTFQCMLAYKKLGISPLVMSAGELESGTSGEPARLIRQRYREAASYIHKGEMSSLFINDLDAGAGRMGSMTQYTVNNQMVNATLMNIADNPNNVQLPGVYKNDPIHRVPIICTGNDFSTLYAPLIRDGRMEKYYWNPSREDRIGVCFGIFKDDSLDRSQIETLVDTFPSQSIDFFGALRSRIYDNAVREYIEDKGLDKLGKGILVSTREQFEFDTPSMDLDTLLAFGQLVVTEQENVRRVQLANEYLNSASLAGGDGSSIPEEYEDIVKK